MAPTEAHSTSSEVHDQGAPGSLVAGLSGCQVVVGSLDPGALRLGIACARYNAEVTARLLAGAQGAWREAGVADEAVVVVEVPGAFELPLAAMHLAESLGVDAVVCLGTVIRGETSHYDLVAGQAAAGCMQVQLDTGVPVAFGVVTTENLEQAFARAGGSHGDKGAEAVATALEMLGAIRTLETAEHTRHSETA